MRNDLYIVVVDPDEEFGAAIRASVRKGDHLRFLGTLEEAIDLMCLQEVDVVFIDGDLYPAAGGFNGSKCGHGGVQVIAASHSASCALAALDAGATDFIVKALPPEELVAAVRSSLRRAGTCIQHSRLVEFIKRKRDQLDFVTYLRNELAIRDEATMAFSESYLRECVADEAERVTGRTIGFSLLLLSFPGFMLYTQQHGEEKGSLVLREIADTLLQRLRKSDVVGRYGSNAFCILLRGTTPADVALMIPGLRERIDTRLNSISSSSHYLNVAFCVVGNPEDGTDPAILFSRLGERRLVAAPPEGKGDDSRNESKSSGDN